MKSKISFYSFKDIDHVQTTRKFRVNKESHFHQFQKHRVDQKISLKKSKSKKKNHSMLSILVKSQQQEELMTFLKYSQFPQINPVRKGIKQNIIDRSSEKLVHRSKLDKILSNPERFKTTYFNDLNKIQLNEGVQEISKTFPLIKKGDWKIKGFLKGQHLMIKGLHKSGVQKYFKFIYFNKDYQEFIRLKVLDQLQGRNQ